MYVYRILEKMLSQEMDDKKKINEVSKDKKNTFPQASNKKVSSRLESAYCLFSNSGESFLGSQKPNKFNIFLSNISHPNKRNPAYKEANDFINNKIKGKTIYYEIVSTKENGDIIADVYLDAEKTICLNILLEEHGLDHSEDIRKTDDLSSFEKSNNLHDSFTDMQIISSEPIKEKKKNDPNKNIGYVIDFGWAPFLNKPENNKSFYIIIDENGSKVTKWGLDLKNAIKNSEVTKGDHIELIKGAATGNSKKNTWSINKLNIALDTQLTQDKSDTVMKKEHPILKETINEKKNFPQQAIPEHLSSMEIPWDEIQEDTHRIPDYEPMDLDDFMNNSYPVFENEEHSIVNQSLNEQKNDNDNKVVKNDNSLPSSLDAMDDILSFLDENDNKPKIKL